MVSETEKSSTLRSVLKSEERAIDGSVEGWSANEMLDLRLSAGLPVVTTETMTPPLLFTKGTDDALQRPDKDGAPMSLARIDHNGTNYVRMR